MLSLNNLLATQAVPQVDPFARASVMAASTSNVNLGAAPSYMDGVFLNQNARVLVKDQANPNENGIYRVDTLGNGSNGIWNRDVDANNESTMVPGMHTTVDNGYVNGGTQWVMTSDPLPAGGLNTNPIAFTEFSGAGNELPQPSLMNYTTVDTNTLLNESFTKVQSIGNTSSFDKLSSESPTFKEMKIDADFGASGSTFSNIGASLAPAPKLDVSASAIKAAGADSGEVADISHKVKLVASVSDGESSVIRNDVNFPHEPLMQRTVEFDIMPEVAEQHSIEYEALSAPHMPGEFQKYKGTKSTQWTITGMFAARTRDEARRNYVFINNLRGWTKPYFGDKQRLQFSEGGGRGKLGAPPPVLMFSGWRGIVGEVPVVLTSVNWSWPKDCDWIPMGINDENGQEMPFPTVMNVNLNIIESFSPQQFNNFDLVAFRNGNMIGAYSNRPPAETYSNEGRSSTGLGVQSTEDNYSNEGRNYGPETNNPDYSNEGRNYLKPTTGKIVPDSDNSDATALLPDAADPTSLLPDL